MNFVLVPQPYLHPGVELLMLQSPRGFVDTGVEMPIGGRVYLSENTVHEAGRLFGMVTRHEAAKLTDEIASLKATVESLGRHLKERDPLFQALKRAMEDDSPVTVEQVLDMTRPVAVDGRSAILEELAR